MADITLPARGAYADLNELIALRFPARQLRLARKNRALSALAGPNKSNFRGRGIDFEEVRSYQPGDDIRTIDWRVTARTGSAHTQLASLIAWSALDAGDRVGGLVFNGAEHREIRPRSSRKTVLALLSQIAGYNHALPLANASAPDSFADMLSNLRRIARPGSSLFLVSDFHGASREHAREHLFQLAQHTELTAVACSDPMESKLPRAGKYAVTDGSARSELHTADKKLRSIYQQRFQRHRDLLSQDLLRLGIPMLQATTDQAPFTLLQQFYGDPRQ